MLHFRDKEIRALKKYLKVKKEFSPNESLLWEKVANYSSIFSYIPGISCICICNSLAMNACHEWSDIDLFVITKKNRLWTARIFLTLVLAIKGERKTKNQHAGKFCLSFFITEDALSLKSIALKNDIYLSYWIQTLKPVINRSRCFQRFMEENSKWLEFFTSPLWLRDISPFVEGENYPSLPFNLKGRVGDGMEFLLKTLFLPRTKKSFQKLWKPSWVVISDTMLKFHDQDKRTKIRDAVLA